MKKKILIPYLSSGLGHFIQAQAISHHLHAMRPGWDVRLMDAARELPDQLMERTFVDLWRVALRMPAAVSQSVFALERLAPPVAVALNKRSFRTAIPKAAAFLDDYRPDLIMSTHWACTHLFSMAQGERRAPLFYLYGELGAMYSVINCGADVYFALTPRIVEGLQRIGIPSDHIRQIPMVVHPDMLRNGTPQEELKARLGIPAAHLAVVLSLGGEGLGHVLPFVEAFARDVQGASLIVLTGRNEELLRVLKKRHAGGNVIALGYQDDISWIISASDVLAGKTGTGYAMLAIAKDMPLLVTHIGAPNERENMRYIVDNGYGWYCPRPIEFARRISMMVRERAAGRGPRAHDGKPIPPNGAESIAAAIVEHLG